MSLQSVFTHVTSIYANLLDKREEFIFHWIGLRHQHGRSLFQAFRRWWEAVRSEVEGGLGRAVRVPSLSSLPPPQPLPRFHFFALLFAFDRSCQSERLEQANMAAVSLFWHTNMEDETPHENPL